MKKTLYLLALITLSILFAQACKEDDSPELNVPDPDIAKVNSCEGCHTNYEHLKKVYTPDPPSTGGGGCGGETPHIEPYDRVYLGGDGYVIFRNSIHGALSCTKCHNGVDGTDEKDVAHSGNFRNKPSLHSDETCVECHPMITLRANNSLHEQGLGQKHMVASRFGANSFDELPEMLKEGYNQNCATCHGTCGDCHVNRPHAGGGGLYQGHNFIKSPNMQDHCTTCHVSRGGHAYYGVAVGTVPDAHLTKAGFTCMNCHSKNEIHGDDNTYNQRYQMELLPSCSDCHSGLANSNNYHSVHLNSFNCNACHSQDYNNCGSCHIGGEGARIHSHQKFKIALNPIPESKPYEFATVRQSLMAPDSWKEYGVDNLANFDSAPTYKYTTPHNIIKWTSRTQVEEGKPCYDACHIIEENGEFRNKELYLFSSDLEEWELNATRSIVVDGKLPASWGIK